MIELLEAQSPEAVIRWWGSVAAAATPWTT